QAARPFRRRARERRLDRAPPRGHGHARHRVGGRGHASHARPGALHRDRLRDAAARLQRRPVALMLICPNCGHENAGGARFCSSCGTRLEQAAAPARERLAALAIREWIRDEGELQVRVAVTTGEALVAVGARPAEGEGMASGDVVNTAARLQSAAPVNGILVDETTYRATDQKIDYEESEPVTAKGKQEPIPAWEVIQAHSSFGVDVGQAQRPPLVGRLPELEVLVSALERVRAERSPQLVTLVGVPGIGKSRLVYELSQVIENEEEITNWRQGRSLPYGEGVSFWALTEMVKAQSGILETDSTEEAAAKLNRSVRGLVDDSEADWVERHLGTLVGLETEQELRGDHRAEAFAAWR